MTNGIYATGRIILGGFFILAGVSKILNPGAPIAMMSEVGMPGWLLPAVIALEVLGGLIIASGRPKRVLFATALVLAAFTLATNAFFHQFWTFEGLMARLEISLFFKNVAIAGALLMVAGIARSNAKKS